MATGGNKIAQRPLPNVCGNYNRLCGCYSESCQDLHVCFYYLTRDCMFKSCIKAHTLETPRNIMLLERMGWSGYDDIELALENLRRKMHGYTISVCLAYNAGSCTAEDCRRLHVCHRSVQDGCPLDDCELSHSVTDGHHNTRVIMAAGMADTPVTELLRLLADQLRQRPYRPAVCRVRYCSAAGCEQKCLRLHCCVPFARGQCRNGTKCSCRHSLGDPHNQRVLRFFGWTESQAMAMFASEGSGDGVDDVAASLPTDTEERRWKSENGGDDVAAQSVEGETLLSAGSRRKSEGEESRNAAVPRVKKREENLCHDNEQRTKRTERLTEAQGVTGQFGGYCPSIELWKQQREERCEAELQVMKRLEEEQWERELQRRDQQQTSGRQEKKWQAREQGKREGQDMAQHGGKQQERTWKERKQQGREQEGEKHGNGILEKEAQEKELLQEYTRLVDNYASNEKTLAAFKRTNEEYVQQIASMEFLLGEFEGRERQLELKMKKQLEELEQTQQNTERYKLEKETREKEIKRLTDKYASTENKLAASERKNEEYAQRTGSLQRLLGSAEGRERQLKAEIQKQVEELERNREDSVRLRTLVPKQQEHMKCTLCLNVFVQPLTLNCSHTFCQACIDSKQRCPFCSQQIRIQMRCSVLDRLADIFRE